MTDAQQMKAEVAAVVRERLGGLSPLETSGPVHLHPDYVMIREQINAAEQELRRLIRGDEHEVHEWLAAIHYALSEERARLLQRK